VHVIAESHDNDRRLVLPPAKGGLGLDAVWSDDFHHALHVRLTGESGGYYVDFAGAGMLERALGEGFAFQGEFAEYWGRRRGAPSADLPGERFVICAQNHDQVGNRAEGQRLGALVPFEALKLAAALLLVAPAVPLLFMGEEYGETAPFQFFTSFLDPALAERVRVGRQAEFKGFAWQGEVPDPGNPATFVRSHLNHALASAPRHAALREYYRAWLAARLGARHKGLTRVETVGAVLIVTRSAPGGEGVRLVANLSGTSQPWPPAAEGAGAEWRRPVIDSADPRFGGRGQPVSRGLSVPLGAYQVVLFDAPR
jgi:maltooligosyltrehalose trehalohydrolase